jgi:hypothetical protein
MKLRLLFDRCSPPSPNITSTLPPLSRYYFNALHSKVEELLAYTLLGELVARVAENDQVGGAQLFEHQLVFVESELLSSHFVLPHYLVDALILLEHLLVVLARVALLVLGHVEDDLQNTLAKNKLQSAPTCFF